MPNRIYLRSIEVLQNLDARLSQFNSSANAVLENTARDIKASQERLKARMTYWQAELRRRQNAYEACRRRSRSNCRTEAIAVQQAQEAIEKLQRLSSRLEQAIGEYEPHANRLQQFLGSKLGKAKGDLRRSIGKYHNYLNQGIFSASAISSGSSKISQNTKTENLSVSPNSTGTFSIYNWSGYPKGPKPNGPFRILEDEQYEMARKEANSVNSAIHKANPSLEGLDIHEVHPVKFGGSPTDPANKIPLTRIEHAKYTTWWNKFLRNMNN